MSKALLKGFETTPDTGMLKNATDEYDFLQNVRGWGGLGSKRRGIQYKQTLTAGCLGLFDLSNNGDPRLSTFCIAIDANGNITTYDFTSELL